MGKNGFVCFEVPIEKQTKSNNKQKYEFLSCGILIPREEILHGKSLLSIKNIGNNNFP